VNAADLLRKQRQEFLEMRTQQAREKQLELAEVRERMQPIIAAAKDLYTGGFLWDTQEPLRFQYHEDFNNPRVVVRYTHQRYLKVDYDSYARRYRITSFLGDHERRESFAEANAAIRRLVELIAPYILIPEGL
jgi:hypothetical protein